MSKNAKFLLFLTSLALLLVIYLIISSKQIMAPEETENDISSGKNTPAVSQVDIVKMGNEYQASVKAIVAEMEILYSRLAETEAAASTEAEPAATSSAVASDRSEFILITNDLRDRLIDLTVPEQYRQMHLDLVLSLDKVINYFDEQTADIEIESQNILTRIINDNPWLSS